MTLNLTLDSDTASEIATLENVSQTWLPSSHGGHHQATYSISPANNSVQNLDQNATIKLENSNSPNHHQHHNHNNHHQSSASVSPASFAEEVTLPFTCVTGPGSTHSSGKSIINRCLMVSTDQADSRCFYILQNLSEYYLDFFFVPSI